MPQKKHMASKSKFLWNPRDLLKLYIYLGLLYFAIINLPNEIWDSEIREIFIALGVIGLWRYSWWTIHFIRAQIYARLVFPHRKKKADALWEAGWRPSHVYFMMTTFRENPDTTTRVLQSIMDECASIDVPATLFVGTGHDDDERIIEDFFAYQAREVKIDVVIVRQNQPGKRFAIGLVLRTMARKGAGGDDPVVFMDGDVILAPDCLRKCLPFFGIYQKMRALTTDEKAIVFGPKWIQNWLDLRFAQRSLAMQSHALSNKVLTLTGRMSIFRAKDVIKEDFIRMIEADHLNHWLWGKFRFLSGDDKSTWYWLLREGADMFYIPDALVYTIEYVHGSGFERMKANLLRWSGNMLRNGSRAIALGPRRVGLFIWWCIVDQRIAIWTTLVSPIAALVGATLVAPAFLIAYIVWIAFTRLLISLFLFHYAGRINISFPLLLYVNQMLNAVLKAYIWFRLPKQRWSNRGDQQARYQVDFLWRMRQVMAIYLTTLFVSGLVYFVMIYIGVIKLPSAFDLESFISYF